MAQVNVFVYHQALSILVRKNDGSGSFWLPHSIGSTWVIQKTVVDATGIPCIDLLCTSERGVADERVASAVVVTSTVMRTIVIFL